MLISGIAVLVSAPASAAVPAVSILADATGEAAQVLGHRQVDQAAALGVQVSVTGDPATVVWTSSAPAVAAVTGDQSGAIVTGGREGIATITVEASNDEGTASDSIVVSVTDPTFTPIDTAYLSTDAARLADADATASAAGTAASGTRVRLLAASRSYFLAVTASHRFWVRSTAVRIPAVGITLTPATATIPVGETTIVTAHLEPALANDPIMWTTTNRSKVAVVGNGRKAAVGGRQVGTTDVTATVSDLSASARIRVAAPSGRALGMRSVRLEPLELTSRLPARTDEPPIGGQEIPYNPYWRGCNGYGTSDKYKVVKKYDKTLFDPRMRDGYVRLYCGRKDTEYSDGKLVESRFGYRHLVDKHRGEFQMRGWKMGRQWQALVGWQLDWIAEDPFILTHYGGPGTGRAARFCYERQFKYLVDDDTIETEWVVMLTGKTSVRIITAFPPTKNDGLYCKSQGGETIFERTDIFTN